MLWLHNYNLRPSLCYNVFGCNFSLSKVGLFTYLLCDPLRKLICCNKWHPGTLVISTQPEKAVKAHFHARHRSRTTPIFLPVNLESFWLLLVPTSKLGLLTIIWHSAAKKGLFHFPEVTSHVWKNQKRINININYNYHQSSSP